VENVASVKTAEAMPIINAMLGDTGVVISADRVFWNQYLEKLNPTCTFGDDGKWVTYFTEDPKVTACSTRAEHEIAQRETQLAVTGNLPRAPQYELGGRTRS